MCKNYLPVWKKLIQEYQSQKITFKTVRCNVADTLGWNDMRFSLNVPSIENGASSPSMSSKWQIETVPAVLVVNNNNNSIIYCGATDDRIVETGSYKSKASRFYLREVLEKLNTNVIPPYKNIPVKGCYIED